MANVNVEMKERLIELELALEKEGWISLADNFGAEFSRTGINNLIELARLYFVKNPLIKRGIRIRTFYVFGRGMNIHAQDDTINEVIQAFRDDQNNQAVLTGKQANKQADIDLAVDGNLFIALFVHPVTGNVRVDVIPVQQITNIIKDPENRRTILYYKRDWAVDTINFETGAQTQQQRSAYYRAFTNRDTERTTIGGIPINNDCVIYHVKVNAIADWNFGISDVYVAQDWAKAYTSFLSDYASIVRSLARFAWRKKVTGGVSAVQAARLKMTTKLGQPSIDTNPPPASGAISIEAPGNELDPIKTAGSTTSAEEARPIRNMVATAFDIPETFYADVNTGNLATATSLDRPTELSFLDRQDLWEAIYRDLINFVIYNAVSAPQGPLKGLAELSVNEYGEPVLLFDASINQRVDIGFPSILERDTQAFVQAIVSAVTLDGKVPSVITDRKWIASTMLSALGFDDTDELIDDWYPDTSEDLTNAPETINQAIETLREVLIAVKDEWLDYATTPTNTNGKHTSIKRVREATRSGHKG